VDRLLGKEQPAANPSLLLVPVKRRVEIRG